MSSKLFVFSRPLPAPFDKAKKKVKVSDGVKPYCKRGVGFDPPLSLSKPTYCLGGSI